MYMILSHSHLSTLDLREFGLPEAITPFSARAWERGGLVVCVVFDPSKSTPYSKYPAFFQLVTWYHVDPLLRKQVFTMENQVFPTKIQLKAGILSRG